MTPRWTPGIGDPGVTGWVTVAAYMAAAGACAVAAGRESRQGGGTGARFWAMLAAAMLALGINKQLDVQSLFTQVARDAVTAWGWYEQRRALQVAFIFGVAVAGVISMVLALRRLSLLRRTMRVAIVGIVFVFTYVFLRASSFHHVDLFINRSVAGVKWNAIFELTGIMIVLGAAIVDARRARSPDV